MDGHDLAREQIAIHGRDRYPTVGAQYAKVLDELGELGEALMERQTGHKFAEHIRSEYADVGLALFELGNKMGLDLIACMSRVVSSDKRDFREKS